MDLQEKLNHLNEVRKQAVDNPKFKAEAKVHEQEILQEADKEKAFSRNRDKRNTKKRLKDLYK
ncbi:hypothetical protein [Photobacterium indicum]|uniref:hypothetical protein n=1 Tax=Photobacterium indicum TaxID=81447 RepID=UPI003D15096D